MHETSGGEKSLDFPPVRLENLEVGLNLHFFVVLLEISFSPKSLGEALKVGVGCCRVTHIRTCLVLYLQQSEAIDGFSIFRRENKNAFTSLINVSYKIENKKMQSKLMRMRNRLVPY